MTTYIVRWEIEIDADSPEAAAAEALEIQRDPDSIATSFDIYNERGDKFIKNVDFGDKVSA